MSENAKRSNHSENERKNEQDDSLKQSAAESEATLSPEQAEEILAEESKSAEDYKAIIEDLNDKMLRAMAEAQNMRRRADLDIQNAKSFSIQSLAGDLLGVMDNLFRACDNIPDTDEATEETIKNIKEGIEITKREMINVFERHGIKRIEPMGLAFDPNLHQAMSQIVDKNAEPGTVVQVLQAGYILKDRLLRPALVVVSKVE